MLILKEPGALVNLCTIIQTLDRCSSRGHLLKVRISKLKRPAVWFWCNIDGWIISSQINPGDPSIICWTCCDSNIMFHRWLKCSITETTPPSPSSAFEKCSELFFPEMLENVALHVQPSPPGDAQARPPLAPSSAMTPVLAGVGVTSGCAWIWSEQSDGAGEASHASLGVQREGRERLGEEAQWVRGVQMVDNSSYMLSTFPTSYFLHKLLAKYSLSLSSLLCGFEPS